MATLKYRGLVQSEPPSLVSPLNSPSVSSESQGFRGLLRSASLEKVFQCVSVPDSKGIHDRLTRIGLMITGCSFVISFGIYFSDVAFSLIFINLSLCLLISLGYLVVLKNQKSYTNLLLISSIIFPHVIQGAIGFFELSNFEIFFAILSSLVYSSFIFVYVRSIASVEVSDEKDGAEHLHKHSSVTEECDHSANSEKANQSRAERSIQIMQSLKNKSGFEATDVEFVIATLAAGNLYTPDVNEPSDHLSRQIFEFHDHNKLACSGAHLHDHDQVHDHHEHHDHDHDHDHHLGLHDDCSLPLSPEVSSLLGNICDWDFPVFELARLTDGKPLYFMGQALFRYHKLVEKFNIDRDKLHHFLEAVESGYHSDNPYHNNTHACDVAQTLNFYLTKGGVGKNLTITDIFAAVVAALVHDIDHPGVNNNFEIATMSPKALLHNDISVLENHHCSIAFQILSKKKNDIFSGVSKEVRKELRSTIIEMVLATDFSKHLEVVGLFNSRKAAGDFDGKIREHRLLMLRMAIKCADLSHTSKGRPLHLDWTSRVITEFYNQGDQEKNYGLPISSFMDRESPDVPKSQFGFLNFMVLPMLDSFAQVFPDCKVCFDQLGSNLSHWKSQM